MRSSGSGSIIVGALALLSVVSPVAAQNRYSFGHAAKAPRHHAHATGQPKITLPDVRSLATGGLASVAVEIVAAADGVPQHCRVTGAIAPEIRFEVNLPAAWNRRFYMSGNGGFLGGESDSPPRPPLRAAALRHGFVT